VGRRVTYGVGAHEPIYHRLRTGNSTAEEWRRWERETSIENLDLLGELGVTHALIACTKGFGLEHEKPLIERAARFAEQAAQRGIATRIYVQGFPVYYETFLVETPEAADWLARRPNGDVIGWGGQTFRRWMDPTRREFWDYQRRLLAYVLDQFTPAMVFMDNTNVAPSYTDSARESFRAYLRETYAGRDVLREFGIGGFDAVDLPHFDPVYYPPDAYRVVKDPLLQEWARWRSAVQTEYLRAMRDAVKARAPDAPFGAGAGCDGLRTNHLFNSGIDFEERLAALDRVWMEESGWRPGAFESTGDDRQVVMDERIAQGRRPSEAVAVRVSTDSRWWKIASNYGRSGHGGFWGEVDRESKLIALAHNFAFAEDAADLGVVGPLAAATDMLDDIRDAVAWARDHLDVLTGREERLAPIAVWRGTSTLAFIRHRPVWAACAVEQMLYERHLPFTILLDGSLRRCLGGRRLLVLPETACVSDAQVRLITDFVDGGSSLLLLGPAGTRDERTRLRRTYAFAGLFGESMPAIEHFGPPHWVPELDFSAMPERLDATFGAGRVALIRDVVPVVEPDMTRDPYSPERKVAPKDVLPPANEGDILAAAEDLLGEVVRVEGPRSTLCEYWRRGSDLLVCCANLRRGRGGGPLTVRLGPCRAESATVHELLADSRDVPVVDGAVRVDSLDRFCVVEIKGAW